MSGESTTPDPVELTRGLFEASGAARCAEPRWRGATHAHAPARPSAVEKPRASDAFWAAVPTAGTQPLPIYRTAAGTAQRCVQNALAGLRWRCEPGERHPSPPRTR